MGKVAEIFGQIGDIVMQILLQLGANKTAFIQIALFIITISFLTKFVFNPYFKALDERHKRTKGAGAVARETQEEAKSLQSIYQAKAREINDKIKNIFDIKKSEAQKKSAEILSQAKADAEASMTKTRQQIETQKAAAQSQIAQISNEIAQDLKQKFEAGL